MNKEIFSVDEIEMKNSEVYSNKNVGNYAQIQSIDLDEMKQKSFLSLLMKKKVLVFGILAGRGKLIEIWRRMSWDCFGSHGVSLIMKMVYIWMIVMYMREVMRLLPIQFMK